MPKKRLAIPSYDFKVINLTGKELISNPILRSDMIIFTCIRGDLTLQLNGETHIFRAGTNFLLPDGIVLKFIACSEDAEVNLIAFSTEFMNEIYPVLDLKMYKVLERSAPDWYPLEKHVLTHLLVEQFWLLYKQEKHNYRNQFTKNTLINYLYEIYEQTHIYTAQESEKPKEKRSYLINIFYTLLINDGYLHHRNLNYYAEKMHITPRYLHKVCKESVQMTPKQCIDYMVLGNAKKLLLTTDLNSQQIADALHFSDQSTFGQFFKRNVGVSPLEFRQQYK